jgi:hypothetical protein
MKKLFFLMAASFLFAPVHAQITERERPAEWQHLVKGARFMDRFLPMPDGIQAKGIWGTDSVLNRKHSINSPFHSKNVILLL